MGIAAMGGGEVKYPSGCSIEDMYTNAVKIAQEWQAQCLEARRLAERLNNKLEFLGLGTFELPWEVEE